MPAEPATIRPEAGDRVLTICQPWAWAIVCGYKRAENRSWRTPHRGRLWIHAGLSRRWMDEAEALRAAGFPVPAAELILSGRRQSQQAGGGLFGPPDPREVLIFGAIIGRVELVDCREYDEQHDGGDLFASGPVLWILEGACHIRDPVPARGQQSLWTWDFPAGAAPAGGGIS